ncbi:MAG: photosystem II reaction center protein Psb28 [Oscillatoriales cyanobacterium C42_A2020_001]|nr:photosystem II reaction center protein Psb28 [Leptolyngbyaceae cyanobacterium C42_A2020_001]
MTTPPPSIQFFDGISEELDNVSLRRNRLSGARIVVMVFRELRAIAQFNSFRYRFSQCLKLVDSEGEISIEPSSVKFYFGGPEGDELERMECRFELEQDDHWERFSRFMERYAAANAMEYGERKPGE